MRTEPIGEPTRVGMTWVWEDGTTVPVVSGGSDTMSDVSDAVGESPAEDYSNERHFGALDDDTDDSAEPDDAAQDNEPDGEPAPGGAAAEGAGGGEAAASEADPFDDETKDTFPRSYVENIRKEAAAHREKAKGYDDAFSGLHDDDASWLLETTKLLKDDPKAAAERFAQAAKALGVEIPEIQEPDDDKPLTKADIDRLFAEKEAERQKEQAAERARTEVHSTLKTLGYEDPSSSDAAFVQFLALRDPNHDIEAAHQTFAKMIDDRVAQVISERSQQNGRHPKVAAGRASSAAKETPEYGSEEWKRMIDGE